MIKLKASECACGMAVMILGLGLNFYSVGELVASLLLLSMAFSLLWLVALTVLCACYAGRRVVVWARAVSPNVTGLTRGLAAHARSGTAE